VSRSPAEGSAGAAGHRDDRERTAAVDTGATTPDDWPSSIDETVHGSDQDGEFEVWLNASRDTGPYLDAKVTRKLFPENAGMLFIFSRATADSLRIMREMDFRIADIIYAGTPRNDHSGSHNAAFQVGPNETGSEQRYRSSGQYVLRSPYKWTDHQRDRGRRYAACSI